MSHWRGTWFWTAWMELSWFLGAAYFVVGPSPTNAVRAEEKQQAEKPILDGSKERVIERPTKTVIENSSSGLPAARTSGENPVVAPGGVRWHPSFESACAAAANSGKPVLLFHLMGRLDQQFC